MQICGGSKDTNVFDVIDSVVTLVPNIFQTSQVIFDT